MPLTLSEFMEMQLDPVSMIVGRGVLPKQGKMIIAGEAKTNKSFVAINLMLALARGKPAFNAFYKTGAPVFPITGPCRVLYIEMELGDYGLHDRLTSILRTDSRELPIWIKTRDMALRLDTDEGIKAIFEEIAAAHPDVTILDPLAKFNLADENEAHEMGLVMRVGDRIIQNYETALIYVHHLNKPMKDQVQVSLNRLRGSSTIGADCDSYMQLTRLDPESCKEPVLRCNFELRRGEPIEPVYLKRLASGEVIYMGEGYVPVERMEPHQPRPRHAKW